MLTLCDMGLDETNKCEQNELKVQSAGVVQMHGSYAKHQVAKCEQWGRGEMMCKRNSHVIWEGIGLLPAPVASSKIGERMRKNCFSCVCGRVESDNLGRWI